MAKIKALHVLFEVIRVQTMQDGAIRYVFETAENEYDLMRDIVECKTRGILLDATMIPIKPSPRESFTGLNDETKQETKRTDVSVARRRLAKRRNK